MDEDSQARAQLSLLRADGHDVVAIGELAKNGAPDPEVFDLAQSLERVLLTHNAEDFHALHRDRPGHHGIIAVYRKEESPAAVSFMRRRVCGPHLGAASQRDELRRVVRRPRRSTQAAARNSRRTPVEIERSRLQFSEAEFRKNPSGLMKNLRLKARAAMVKFLARHHPAVRTTPKR